MGQNKEILDVYFTPEEKEKVKQEIQGDDSFKEKYERIKSIQIDLELDKLEQGILDKSHSYEKRFEAFKKVVEEKEAKLGDKGLVESAKDKAKALIEEKKTEIKNKFLEKIGNTPLIGSWLKNIFSWTEEAESAGSTDFGKKFMGFLGGMILGMFGYNEFKNKWKGTETESIVQGVTGNAKKITESAEGKVEDVIGTIGRKDGKTIKIKDKLSEIKELTVDERIKIYSEGGELLIKTLSGTYFEDKRESRAIYGYLEGKSYLNIKLAFNLYKQTQDFKVLLSNLGISEKLISVEQKKLLESVLNSIVGINSGNIIKSRLSDFKKIINNDKIKQSFGEDLILSISNKNSYEELTLKEIYILFALSVPSFAGELGAKFVSNISGLFSDAKDLGFKIKQEFLTRRENIISKSLLEKFLIAGFGSNKIIEDKNIFVHFKKLKVDISEEQKELDKVVVFKNEIIQRIKGNNKFSFGIENFDEKIGENFTYSQIIELYLLLDGNINKMDNLDCIVKTGILLIIGNSFLLNDKINYFSLIAIESGKKILGEVSDFLSKEEAIFLSTHMKKFGTEALKKHCDTMNIVRTPLKTSVIKTLEDTLGITISKDTSNIGEYLLLATMSGLAVYALPFYISIGVLGTMGATWLIPLFSESQIYKDYIHGKLNGLNPKAIKILEKVKKELNS